MSRRVNKLDGATVRGKLKSAPKLSALADTEFRDTVIKAVSEEGDGWSITGADGWSFLVKKPAPIVPLVGSTARFYGKGIGYAVRGLFIDGVKVFYRTAAEDQRYQDEMLYGRDIRDWLERWDAGRSVWSIQMGGFCPTYEQCLQMAVVEIVRHFVQRAEDATMWGEPDAWKKITARLESEVLPTPAIVELQLSGMQWGAAMNLACRLYRFGPIAVFSQAELKDRMIQITRWFPIAPKK